MKTQVQIIPTDTLCAVIKENMWKVYCRYYNYSRQRFMQRISTNNYFALYHYGKKLIGFTGLRISRVAVDRKVRLLIYFGQTIIEKAFRGQSLIPATGAKLCLKFYRELLSGRMYFWADALTYKAYLVFAKTLNEYYPSRKRANTAAIDRIIAYIGAKHYDDAFCPQRKTVSKTSHLVADKAAEIQPDDLKDADIRFYAEANPRHTEGHGLITIAPVSARNVYLMFRRFIRRAFRPGYRRSQSKTTPSLKTKELYRV